MNKKESSRFKLDVDDLFPDPPSKITSTKPMNNASLPKSSLSPTNSLPDYVPDKNALKINNKEKSEELKDSNPFSFFKLGDATPTPSASSKVNQRGDTKSRLFDDDFDDFIIPKNKKSFLDDDDLIPPLPSQNIKNNQDQINKKKSTSNLNAEFGFPSQNYNNNANIPPFPSSLRDSDSHIPPLPSHGLLDDSEEKQKLIRKLKKSEMAILGYEEKLKQANRTIAQLNQKEEQETIEMERALKLIEKKLSEMQKRAEAAEAENEKLKKTLKIKQQQQQQNDSNHSQCNVDWSNLHEKTNYVVNHMQKISQDSEQSIRGLLNLSKDFNQLMDMLSTIDSVTNIKDQTHKNNNNDK